MTGTANGNWNCSPCAINADAAPFGGLQQVLWYNESISLTLDTVSIYVTTYNESNATAITRYSTIYGDVSTLNVDNIPAAQSIYSKNIKFAIEQYEGGGSVFLARGRDGSIGSMTSYGWPTPYVLISAIAYTTTVPYSGCPSGLQPVSRSVLAGYDCGCILDAGPAALFNGAPVEGIPGLSATEIRLPSNFYLPISSADFNFPLLESGMLDEFAFLNMTDLLSWLVKQPWATTLLPPNLRHCVLTIGPQGPPGVKIPVSALTKTVVTTTQGVNSLAPSSAEHSTTNALPGPTPTPIPTSTPTLSLSTSPSTTFSPKGSSDVPSDMSSSRDSSTVIISGDSTVLTNGREPTISVTTSVSSQSTALAAQISDAPVSASTRISIVAINSEMYPHPSSTSALAVLATQAVVASQTLLLPSSAVSQLVVAGTTLAATGPAATIGGQVVSLQSGELVVGTSTHSFAGPGGSIPVATVGGYVVHSSPDYGAVVVAGTTMNPGASAVTIAGTAVSLGASDLVIGSSTIALASSPLNVIYATSPQPITPYPTEVMTLGHTITQGAPAITISGTAISLGSTGLMIGSKTVSLPSSPLNVVHTTSPQPIIPYPSEIVTLGHTITQGAPAITISGTAISLGYTGLLIGSKTISISFSASRAVFTIAGQVITPFANGVVIAGQTISQGAPAITMSGTVISLGPSGLVLGSSTIPLPTQGPSSTFVLGGQTFTANGAAIAIGGTTLTEGAPAATISGTPISSGPSGVIIGSSTYALPTSLPSSVLIINGETFTINPTGVRVSGSTLAMNGSAITIDGTRMSLGTAGLVVGTSTIPYDDAGSLHTTQGIGDAIMAGFGTSTGATSSAATGATTGATTGAIANGTVPGETVYPPIFTGESMKMSLNSLFVAIAMPVMAFMVSLGG
jgi:hypothetical protein